MIIEDGERISKKGEKTKPKYKIRRHRHASKKLQKVARRQLLLRVSLIVVHLLQWTALTVVLDT